MRTTCSLIQSSLELRGIKIRISALSTYLQLMLFRWKDSMSSKCLTSQDIMCNTTILNVARHRNPRNTAFDPRPLCLETIASTKLRLILVSTRNPSLVLALQPHHHRFVTLRVLRASIHQLSILSSHPFRQQIRVKLISTLLVLPRVSSTV